MRIVYRFLILLTLISSSLFALSDKELAISIDLSGKQRMLTQKMTKEAFLIKLKIDTEENRKRLSKSSELFDKTLKGLMQGDQSLKLVPIKSEEIQKQLKKVEKLWIPFHKEIKNVITGKTDKSTYETLESQNITLLKTMNRAVYMYAAQNKGFSKLTLANDINLAGKQRMLTQKMGKDLLLANNNIKSKTYKEDFKDSRKLFTVTLKGLFKGDKELNLKGTNLPKIVNQLKIVQKQWEVLQPLLDKALEGKDVSKAISGLDAVLVEMNKAVILYTQSLNRQKQRLQFSSLVNSFINNNKILKKRVNLSGKQRMLTQRIAKLSILVNSDIDKKENAKRLAKFSNLYNKTLVAFKKGDKELGLVPSKNSAVDKQISVIEKIWETFYGHVKKIIDGKDSDGKSLAYIIDNNEKLLKASDDLVKAYEKSNTSQNYLEKSRLRIVNVAGRQRMLTQKMTKEKLLIAEGHSEYSDKLKATIELFDKSLYALINGDSDQMIVKPTDKKIKAQLMKVEKMWKRLKPLYEKEKLSKKEMMVIIEQNPLLLKEMNKAVNMSETSVEY